MMRLNMGSEHMGSGPDVESQKNTGEIGKEKSKQSFIEASRNTHKAHQKFKEAKEKLSDEDIENLAPGRHLTKQDSLSDLFFEHMPEYQSFADAREKMELARKAYLDLFTDKERQLDAFDETVELSEKIRQEMT